MKSLKCCAISALQAQDYFIKQSVDYQNVKYVNCQTSALMRDAHQISSPINRIDFVLIT